MLHTHGIGVCLGLRPFGACRFGIMISWKGSRPRVTANVLQQRMGCTAARFENEVIFHDAV